MRVAVVVILRVGTRGTEVDGVELNGLAERIEAAAGDVSTPGNQHRIVEEIIWRAVLLKNDHYVLDHGRGRESEGLRPVTRSQFVAVDSADGESVIAARRGAR